MAEITYTPIEEPDGLNAASLNGPFTTIRNGINDLPEGAPAIGALNENHLPSMIVAQNSIRVGGVGQTHTYTSGTFTVITRGGTDLEIDFGADIPLGTGTGVGGVLVFLEVYMSKLASTASGDTFITGKGFTRISAAAGGGGAYAGLQRTMRYSGGGFSPGGDHNGTSQRIVHSTQTLITDADVGSLRKVRGTVRVDPSAGVNAQTMTLHECWLSAIVLRSSET
jgi:hypothetical protein